MSNFVTVSYWTGLIFSGDKLELRKHEAGRVIVCVPIDVVPNSRYSAMEGTYPVLLHVDSTNQDTNVSRHCNGRTKLLELVLYYLEIKHLLCETNGNN